MIVNPKKSTDSFKCSSCSMFLQKIWTKPLYSYGLVGFIVDTWVHILKHGISTGSCPKNMAIPWYINFCLWFASNYCDFIWFLL